MSGVSIWSLTENVFLFQYSGLEMPSCMQYHITITLVIASSVLKKQINVTNYPRINNLKASLLGDTIT
jgi:hypothetical protein